MILSLQTFTTMLETMSAGLQGRAVQLVDLSVGSVLRALLEACASIALWMQWLILQVLSMTRASTSIGADLDSWMADFSFTRLPGSTSSGFVTFSRFTTGMTALVPKGTVVLTSDGTQSFTVVQDLTNPAWSNEGTGYSIAANVGSVTLPVQALTAGAVGNVLAGTIGLLGSALPGVDQVSNPADFSGGIDIESDTSFRARFQLYINSRSLGTSAAIGSAISSLSQGIRYTVLENVSLAGTMAPGNFCVIVDDGGVAGSSTLIDSVTAAVDFVRPIGTTFSVTAASVLPVVVHMSVVISTSAAVASVVFAIQQATSSWISELPMGGLIAVSKLEALAHGVSSSLVSVSATLVNGSSNDLRANPGSVFEIVSVDVSAS